MRPPTPAEQQVLAKYRGAIEKVLNQFRSSDWDENVDSAVDDDATVHPDAGCPLDIDELFQRTYRTHYNSERWNRLIMPTMTKVQAEPDPFKKGKLAKSIQDLMAVQIEVHFNVASIGDAPPPHKASMQIPGAAMVYPTSANALSHGSAYVLAFGNWQDAKWDAANSGYHFNFVHPQNTPYIENIVIQIFGADDRIQQLLKTIDWNAVNEGMTR